MADADAQAPATKAFGFKNIAGPLCALKLSVFPIGKGAKKPLLEWRTFQVIVPTKPMIERWHEMYPDANVGIVCGAASNLVALDVNGAEGAESLAAIEAEQTGRLPMSWRVTTKRGMHIYFAFPEAMRAGLSEGAARAVMPAGLSLRAEGDYIVGPGSVHGGGGVYAWHPEGSPFSGEPLVPLPRSLFLLLTTGNAESPEALPVAAPRDAPVFQDEPTPVAADPWVEEHFERTIKNLLSAPEATRSHVLTGVAYRMGQYIARGMLPRARVVAELKAAALTIGLDPKAVDATLFSAMNAKRQTPTETRQEREAALERQGLGPRVNEDWGEPADTRAGHDPVVHTLEDAPPNPWTFDDNFPTASAQGGHLSELNANDTANAYRFVTRHGRDYLTCPEMGWLMWSGQRWRPDKATWRLVDAADAMRRIEDEAPFLVDAKAQKARLKWSQQSSNSAPLANAIKLASPHLHIEASHFDQYTELLNTPAGVVSLRDGRLHAHERMMYLTQMIAISPDFKQIPSNFLHFMRQTFGGDQDLIDYMQTVMGYCMTGHTWDQCLFFFFGQGQNGKTVMVNLITKILGFGSGTAGGYSFQVPKGALLDDYGTDNLVHLASRFRAMRVIASTEIGIGDVLAESNVKSLTGSDPITARELYKAHHQFWPTHKFIMFGNYRPTIKGVDKGIWRRIKLVPFMHAVPQDAKIMDYEDRLIATEGGGILAWMIQGAQRYLAQGKLIEPPAVSLAIQDYQANQDILGQFIDDHCSVFKPSVGDTEADIPISEDLASAFAIYCENEGQRPWSASILRQKMEHKNFPWIKAPSGRRGFRGVVVSKMPRPTRQHTRGAIQGHGGAPDDRADLPSLWGDNN